MQDVADLGLGAAAESIFSSFTLDQPFSPFQQLLGCLPPGSASLLPASYQCLVLNKDSPLKEYYPQNFAVDLNGERRAYLAIVLLPFIDSHRLFLAEENYGCIEGLSEEERLRNKFGCSLEMKKDLKSGSIETWDENFDLSPGAYFRASLEDGQRSKTIPGFEVSEKGKDHLTYSRYFLLLF
jgi:5'-3' exonuclease